MADDPIPPLPRAQCLGRRNVRIRRSTLIENPQGVALELWVGERVRLATLELPPSEAKTLEWALRQLRQYA